MVIKVSEIKLLYHDTMLTGLSHSSATNRAGHRTEAVDHVWEMVGWLKFSLFVAVICSLTLCVK